MLLSGAERGVPDDVAKIASVLSSENIFMQVNQAKTSGLRDLRVEFQMIAFILLRCQTGRQKRAQENLQEWQGLV
jgi:hypothetical protein